MEGSGQLLRLLKLNCDPILRKLRMRRHPQDDIPLRGYLNLAPKLIEKRYAIPCAHSFGRRHAAESMLCTAAAREASRATKNQVTCQREKCAGQGHECFKSDTVDT